MINALIILFVAAISFALGVRVAAARAKRIVTETAAAHANDPYLGTREWAYEEFADVIGFECPEGHAPAGELCDTPTVWVCLERQQFVEEIHNRGYDYVVSSTAMPPNPGDWIEVDINNDCGHGCKIYRNSKTGVKILWHNSAYGCKL